MKNLPDEAVRHWCDAETGPREPHT